MSTQKTCASCGKAKSCIRRGLCRPCAKEPATSVPEVSPIEQLAADRVKLATKAEESALKLKYAEALKHIERLEQMNEAAFSLPPVQPCLIEPKFGQGTNEGTVVVLASDWHAEEEVNPLRLNNLNEFNLEIARERIERFFQVSVRLTRLLQQDITIQHMVMGLLGDFISGDIHEEVAEVCLLPPMEAIVFVQDLMAGGIEFMLNHTKLTFRFQCHVGNHGRTTKTSRFATENGHSLEYLLYRHLAAHFRNEPRVSFEIAGGPHSYVDIYGKRIRFQHGHMVKYNGGVGGITIPVNKAIGEWNKGIRADLDCFGHFHQLVDGNNFICNGPLVGYNSFALSIKAPYDKPKQSLFLMDKKRGRTCLWPIYFKR